MLSYPPPSIFSPYFLSPTSSADPNRFPPSFLFTPQPALFAYEYERVMGVTASAAAVSSVDGDFQGSVRQYVGKGQVTHRSCQNLECQ